ncbi:competence type IV pilus minor pilin ComGG [Pseudalkalibacillus sp. Hm43]|uniref:competence type IV pilus minor pilin ComGG n=1 Tax=Pseudalkalibacillus sp. Hm43 TaxID=3450742 RepID=UPI003F41CD15
MTALSVMLSILLVSVTVYNIQILNSERDFIRTKTSWFQTSILLQLSREEILPQLRSAQLKSGDVGVFNHSVGRVEYFITDYVEGIIKVRFEAEGTRFGKGTGLLYYDYVNEQVIQWVVV